MKPDQYTHTHTRTFTIRNYHSDINKILRYYIQDYIVAIHKYSSYLLHLITENCVK